MVFPLCKGSKDLCRYFFALKSHNPLKSLEIVGYYYFPLIHLSSQTKLHKSHLKREFYLKRNMIFNLQYKPFRCIKSCKLFLDNISLLKISLLIITLSSTIFLEDPGLRNRISFEESVQYKKFESHLFTYFSCFGDF